MAPLAAPGHLIRQLVTHARGADTNVVVLVRHGRVVRAAIKVLGLERRLGAHSSRRVVSEHALCGESGANQSK